MIYSVERLGDENNHDGWFRVNDSIEVQYVDDGNDNLKANINFNEEVITEQEAEELANEFLQEVLNYFKS